MGFVTIKLNYWRIRSNDLLKPIIVLVYKPTALFSPELTKSWRTLESRIVENFPSSKGHGNVRENSF